MSPLVGARLVSSNLQSTCEIRSNNRNAVREPCDRLEELLQNQMLSANALSTNAITPPIHYATNYSKALTPKSTNIPNSSTPNPINGHLMRISRTPAQNAKVPFHLFLRAKKTNVRWGPSRSVMPIRKRMLPIASRARSKKRIRPSRKKNPPPLQKATPISVVADLLALLRR